MMKVREIRKSGLETLRQEYRRPYGAGRTSHQDMVCLLLEACYLEFRHRFEGSGDRFQSWVKEVPHGWFYNESEQSERACLGTNYRPYERYAVEGKQNFGKFYYA